jgi:hypothetical protein
MWSLSAVTDMHIKQSSELTTCCKETDKDNFLCQVFWAASEGGAQVHCKRKGWAGGGQHWASRSSRRTATMRWKNERAWTHSGVWTAAFLSDTINTIVKRRTLNTPPLTSSVHCDKFRQSLHYFSHPRTERWWVINYGWYWQLKNSGWMYVWMDRFFRWRYGDDLSQDKQCCFEDTYGQSLHWWANRCLVGTYQLETIVRRFRILCLIYWLCPSLREGETAPCGAVVFWALPLCLDSL